MSINIVDIKIKLDKGAKMPTYAHDNDAGMDLCTKRDCVYFIPPHGSMLIDTGVHIQIPDGFYGDLRSKSGLFAKKKIVTTGTIDSGYTGAVKVNLVNYGDAEFMIGDGDKIAQLVIVPYVTAKLEKVKELDETDRADGGFGSTGRK